MDENEVTHVKWQHWCLGGDPAKFPKETEKRVKKFYKELSNKRNYSKFTKFKSGSDEMIVINGLKAFSFCEHHLLPFFGYGTIAYIPDGRILGLSKFQRIVDKVCSRPTLQENVTATIADKIQDFIKPKGIGVSLSCVHACMFGRGINTSTCNVNTQVLRGIIKDKPQTRQEFLLRIRIENIFR